MPQEKLDPIKHQLEFWQDDHSTAMVPANIPLVQKGLMPEWSPRKMGETEWVCQTGKCNPTEMCWECDTVAGQRYYDFFGLGTYNPPERW